MKELPVLVGFTSPYRLIHKDKNDAWIADIEQINKSTYQYEKLSRLSVAFDGNLEKFAVLASYDGAIVIPAFEEHRNPYLAAQIINRILAELTLGGLSYDAISPDDIVKGVLYSETGYVRAIPTNDLGPAAHRNIGLRYRDASIAENITLLNPRTITANEFLLALHTGKKILSHTPTLSPEIVLSGITHFKKHRLVEALVSIWTAVEQVISWLWHDCIIDPIENDPTIKGRRDFLKDNRTWPISTRLEILYQKGAIDFNSYNLLDSTRKARNKFVHAGESPADSAIKNGIDGLFQLIKICQKNKKYDDHLDQISASIKLRNQLEHNPIKIENSQAKYWRSIDPIPGENKWEGNFDRFEFNAVPIEEIQGKK